MKSDRRITLEQLEQSEPCKPVCRASDFTADKLRVLHALEQAGAAGLTTRELMRRGGGMRPPNRIHDLRENGVAIKTIPEGRGVYRYVLCKFLREQGVKATAEKESPDWYERVTGRPRPQFDKHDFSSLPLFRDAR